MPKFYLKSSQDVIQNLLKFYKLFSKILSIRQKFIEHLPKIFSKFLIFSKFAKIVCKICQKFIQDFPTCNLNLPTMCAKFDNIYPKFVLKNYPKVVQNNIQ